MIQFSAILHAVVPMLLCAGMCSAQATPDSTVLTLNGSAKLLSGTAGGAVIWLTPAQKNQAGAAFITKRVVFDAKYRFSTFFQFQMTDPGQGGASDGMTFVLQTEGASSLGSYGGNLGYTGITPSVAVEFDTWQNGGAPLGLGPRSRPGPVRNLTCYLESASTLSLPRLRGMIANGFYPRLIYD